MADDDKTVKKTSAKRLTPTELAGKLSDELAKAHRKNAKLVEENAMLNTERVVKNGNGHPAAPKPSTKHDPAPMAPKPRVAAQPKVVVDTTTTKTVEVPPAPATGWRARYDKLRQKWKWRRPVAAAPVVTPEPVVVDRPVPVPNRNDSVGPGLMAALLLAAAVMVWLLITAFGNPLGWGRHDTTAVIADGGSTVEAVQPPTVVTSGNTVEPSKKVVDDRIVTPNVNANGCGDDCASKTTSLVDDKSSLPNACCGTNTVVEPTKKVDDRIVPSNTCDDNCADKTTNLVVEHTPPPVGTACNSFDCLIAKFEAICPGFSSFKFEGAIKGGIDAVQVMQLALDSKKCPKIVPSAPPKEKIVIKKVPVYVEKPVVVPETPPLYEPPVVGYSNNRPDARCSTCRMYRDLNDEDESEPVYDEESLASPSIVPQSRASGDVCVHVLQREPSALVLRDGPYNTGPAIVGWKPSTIGWHRARGGYLGRVCFPAQDIADRDAVTLCGAVAHSTFRRHHIRELLARREIPASDPACFLGRYECARYGL